MTVKPTPTQAENDKAASGEVVMQKEADGSEEQSVEPRKAEPARNTQGKPTPTQAENDAAASGEVPLQKEADGSDEELPLEGAPRKTRAMQAEKPAAYQTRAVKPAPPKTE